MGVVVLQYTCGVLQIEAWSEGLPGALCAPNVLFFVRHWKPVAGCVRWTQSAIDQVFLSDSEPQGHGTHGQNIGDGHQYPTDPSVESVGKVLPFLPDFLQYR